MATQTTGGGSTTSFSNTPQAQDDAFAWTEDQLKSSGLYNVNTNTITLDVMANDLGGKAKTLWSIDDGGTDAMSELLKSNVTTSWEKTAAGNWMRICDGKVEFRLDDGSHTAGSARSLDSLTAADRVQDSFVYAIRLGNGTLSYAKVTVDISGQNDAAELGGKFTGDVTEAGGTNNNNTGTPSASGTVAVYDVDVGEKHFKAVSDAALKGTYGNFSFNPTTGEWSYTLENGREATQGLKAGQVMTETLKVWSADGAASKDIVVTVNGTNDAPAVSGAVTGGATEGGSAVTLNALANASDVDDNTTLQVAGVPAQLPAGVTYDAATHSFTLDPTHTAYNHLADGQPTTVTVNYAVSDGITSTPATVTWTVTGTNDAPTNTVPGAQTINSNTTTAIAGVAVADVDSANVSTTVSVAHGKLAVGTGGGVTVSNNATATVTISGTLTQVNAALAALSYVSDTNYGGTDTLTVTTSDGSLGDTDTVALTVNAPANQAPDAPTFAFNPGSVSGDDGNKLASGTVLGAFAAVDPNGDPLTYSFSGGTTTGLALNPTAGALTLTSDLNNQDLTFNVVATDSHGNQSVSTTVRVWIGNAGGNGQTFTNNSGTIIAFGLNQEDTITIVAGSGHDALVGGAGDDSLSGGGGNDWLSGGAGDDVLNGGSGSNILIGGAGGDTFDFGNFGATANHVTDFEAGTSSTTVDKLRFDVGTGAGEFSVGNNDLTVNNFKSGNNAAINVAGTEIAVKTDASVTNASVQSTINSYGNITSGAFFVFHNSDLGHAAVYYDPNPSAAGGAILVTELDNVTLLGNLGNLNAGDFQFS
ncbi:VCBS domain-containing protein (plasmid) [Ensifer adhaerens]|uniref:VCBS domain-containing protein n=1 Tax=Ensifer adhaerens TaxID=106592 RepID=UPI001CCD1183|nr:VCBS domain-containing protein [Ensifer adhaerens]MBZ7927702.1 VCBS domain-containing protein [Ensifer adhaerens]